MVGLGCINSVVDKGGTMEVPQSTHADAKTKTKGCSLQTDSGNPLLRTTPIQHIDHGLWITGTFCHTGPSVEPGIELRASCMLGKHLNKQAPSTAQKKLFLSRICRKAGGELEA